MRPRTTGKEAVHCRTGSLEILRPGFNLFCHVHCRTGSLERTGKALGRGDNVHCRTGSLEKLAMMVENQENVHCRTGSLEKTISLYQPADRVHSRTGSLTSYSFTARLDLPARGGFKLNGCTLTIRTGRCNAEILLSIPPRWGR